MLLRISFSSLNSSCVAYPVVAMSSFASIFRTFHDGLTIPEVSGIIAAGIFVGKCEPEPDTRPYPGLHLNRRRPVA